MPANTSPFLRRPVVTGVGPIASLGVGSEDFWRGMTRGGADGRAPFHDPAAEGIASPPFPLFSTRREAVAEVLARREATDLASDPEVALAGAACLLAIEDSRAREGMANAALVVSYEAPGMDAFLRGLVSASGEAAAADAGARAAAFRRFYDVHRERAYSTQSFLHLHALAKATGIHGPTLFINNACASGLYAIDAAALLIEGRRADLAVVAAAESPRFPTKALWFAEGGLYATDGQLRPFDNDRSGLVLGEGAAALVLEPLELALGRGAHIYAEYMGGAFNQEGWKVTMPNFAEPYHERVLRGACSAAGVTPAQIDVLVAHGAGTRLSDAYEAKGITAVFGEWPGRPLIASFKGHFGHMLGACALIESVALLLAMDRGVLPGTAGFTKEDPKLKVRPVNRPKEGAIHLALKVSNAFAGFNAAGVFRKLA